MRIVLAALLFCASAQGIDFAAAVVKTDSRQASPQGLRFAGSGLLFHHAGKSWVITSDHVILHSNSGFTHWIITQEPQIRNATYVASDWGYGLALLEIPSLAGDTNSPELADLDAAAIPAKDEQVTTVGFGAGSDLLVDPRGRVLNPAIDRQLFVFVEKLIQVGGAHGEFGMSGGLALEGDRYLGLLSHQELRNSENLLYVIPGHEVKAWLDSYFSDPAHYEPRLFQGVHYQLEDQANREKIFIGGFQWWLSDYTEYAGGRHRVTKVGVARLPHGVAPVGRIDDPGHLIDRVRTYLTAHDDTVDILHFRGARTEPARQALPRVHFNNLVHFFRLVMHPGFESIAQIDFNAEGPTRDALSKIAHGMKDTVNRVGSTLETETVWKLGARLAEIADILDVEFNYEAQGDNWAELTPGDMNEIIDGPYFKPAWAWLQKNKPEVVDPLLKALSRIRGSLMAIEI